MIMREWDLFGNVLSDILKQFVEQEAKAKAAAKAKEKAERKCKEMSVEELEKVLDQVRNRPITDELEKIIAQIKEAKSVKTEGVKTGGTKTEDAKTEGVKKEEKVSLSKDKEMLYLVKFTETELRALYRLLLNGICTVRSKNLYEGLHTASEKIYKVYVNNFYGGHE